MRVRYTVRRKLALLALAERIMEEEGVSLRRAAARLQVAHSLIVKWQQERASNADPILAVLKCKKKSMHPGPLGQLKSLKDTLLRYVFEQREQGINVNTVSLVVKASSLSPEFNAKDFVARESAVNRFVRAHSLVYRMGTHESQRKPDKVAAEASDYTAVMRRLVDGPHRDRRFILNMDQTPVYFCTECKEDIGVDRSKNRTHFYVN